MPRRNTLLQRKPWRARGGITSGGVLRRRVPVLLAGILARHRARRVAPGRPRRLVVAVAHAGRVLRRAALRVQLLLVGGQHRVRLLAALSPAAQEEERDGADDGCAEDCAADADADGDGGGEAALLVVGVLVLVLVVGAGLACDDGDCLAAGSSRHVFRFGRCCRGRIRRRLGSRLGCRCRRRGCIRRGRRALSSSGLELGLSHTYGRIRVTTRAAHVRVHLIHVIRVLAAEALGRVGDEAAGVAAQALVERGIGVAGAGGAVGRFVQAALGVFGVEGEVVGGSEGERGSEEEEREEGRPQRSGRHCDVLCCVLSFASVSIAGPVSGGSELERVMAVAVLRTTSQYRQRKIGLRAWLRETQWRERQ